MNAVGATMRIPIKNILYATDFSLAAELALPYVKELARKYGATVHGVHVRFPTPYPAVKPDAMPEIMKAAEEQVRIDALQLTELLAGVPHDVSVSRGKLWPTILDVVRKQKIDLIVIGTRGRTGVGRALLGSVAEEIFRSSPCPVLTVGPRITEDPRSHLEMKEILYATDFSAESFSALPYAVSLAQEHQARLTILHVVEESAIGDLVHPNDCEESTLRRLRELVPSEAKSWCELSFIVEQGPAAEKILEIAAETSADLIVLGVRRADGHLASTTHLFRPTAHRIVTHAACPVLTVRM